MCGCMLRLREVRRRQHLITLAASLRTFAFCNPAAMLQQFLQVRGFHTEYVY